jgi:hypothetical protein
VHVMLSTIDKESASDAPAVFESRLHHHFRPNLQLPTRHTSNTRNLVPPYCLTKATRFTTMLLTSAYYSHMPNQHYATHTPIRSSPLRERSANAGAGLFDFNAMSQQTEKQAQPQRAYKANPIVQTRDAATKRRRDMFFKRVQNNREDKKWESRGEQVCLQITQS